MTYTIYKKDTGETIASTNSPWLTTILSAVGEKITLSELRVIDREGRIWEAIQLMEKPGTPTEGAENEDSDE